MSLARIKYIYTGWMLQNFKTPYNHKWKFWVCICCFFCLLVFLRFFCGILLCFIILLWMLVETWQIIVLIELLARHYPFVAPLAVGPEAQYTEKLTAAIPLCDEAWLLFVCMWNFRPCPHTPFAILLFQLLAAWCLSLRQDGCFFCLGKHP